ncbi:hypothetical protein ACFL28_05595, partial [Candidatus Omnitrophota bacterium]
MHAAWRYAFAKRVAVYLKTNYKIIAAWAFGEITTDTAAVNSDIDVTFLAPDGETKEILEQLIDRIDKELLKQYQQLIERTIENSFILQASVITPEDIQNKKPFTHFLTSIHASPYLPLLETQGSRQDILHQVSQLREGAKKPQPAGQTANTLLEAFGPNAIRSVFDAGTGTGGWMRKIEGQPWLASDARIVGFDLERPSPYEGEPDVIPEEDWQDLTVVHDSGDEDYPKPGTVYLLHEAFMHVEHVKSSGTKRLDEYDSIVREGGWFLFAHNDRDTAASKVPREHFIQWLEDRGYPFQVYNIRNVPTDYPTSYWWGRLSREVYDTHSVPRNYPSGFWLDVAGRPTPRDHLYLIVARKVSLRQVTGGDQTPDVVGDGSSDKELVLEDSPDGALTESDKTKIASLSAPMQRKHSFEFPLEVLADSEVDVSLDDLLKAQLSKLRVYPLIPPDYQEKVLQTAKSLLPLVPHITRFLQESLEYEPVNISFFGSYLWNPKPADLDILVVVKGRVLYADIEDLSVLMSEGGGEVLEKEVGKVSFIIVGQDALENDIDPEVPKGIIGVKIEDPRLMIGS